MAGISPARSAGIRGDRPSTSIVALTSLRTLGAEPSAQLVDAREHDDRPIAHAAGGHQRGPSTNGVCLVMLWRRRTDDINMRSAWVCSLNDVAGSAAVLVASAAVAMTGTGSPDLIVGVMIATMFGLRNAP